MTIASTVNRNDYVGNGAVDTYTYAFKIFSDTDLLVTQRDDSSPAIETTLTLDVDYTVTGTGGLAGGTIVLTAGNLTTGYLLAIRRVRSLTQGTDIRNQGDFLPEIHEDQFDILVMQDQQQQNDIDRSLRLPETGTGISTELAIPEALKLMRWDAAGTALENVNVADLGVVSTFGPEFGFSAGNLTITVPVRQATAGGTVDAITATVSPAPILLTNSLTVTLEASGANATTTPTLNLNSLGAKTIVKGSNTPLLVGDIAGANFRMTLSFDTSLDKWVLLNPDQQTGEIIRRDGTVSMTGTLKTAQGGDVVSEAALFTTAGFPTDGNSVDVTGTTPITSMLTSGTLGTFMILQFDGILPLTHHATDLKLPGGATITTAAGDVAILQEYASGDWRCVNYTRASGKSIVAGGDYILLRDEKASGTDGGGSTLGSWLTRDINTEVVDTGNNAAIATNQITLQPGTYRFDAFSTLFFSGEVRLRLQNITDATTVDISVNVGTHSGAADLVYLSGRFTIAAAKVLELQYRSSATKATNGLGVASTFGVNEIYSEIKFWKEA